MGKHALRVQIKAAILAAFLFGAIATAAQAQCEDDFFIHQTLPLLKHQNNTSNIFKSGNYPQALANANWLITEWRNYVDYGGQCGRAASTWRRPSI
jgi:hypothetical protein